MLRVELPTVQNKEARSLTPQEIELVREGCLGNWTFGVIELALASGARRGELLALQWPDLDWVSGVVSINKSLEQTRAGLRIKRPKNGKSRACRLPQSAIVALQFQREQQRELHTLRHSHASNVLSLGVPLPAVSVRLGHSDTNVTARIYSHALPADDQRAADVWDSILTGKVQ